MQFHIHIQEAAAVGKRAHTYANRSQSPELVYILYFPIARNFYIRSFFLRIFSKEVFQSIPERLQYRPLPYYQVKLHLCQGAELHVTQTWSLLPLL